jgi:hypothetical protein
MVPTQPDPQGEVEWVELRLQGNGGQEPLAARASRKLNGKEMLITSLAALRLRYELDRALWADHEHVGIKQLWEYLATYLYLPRLRDERVLLEAISGGVAQPTWESETFAYAEGWDDAQGRYRGLVCGLQARIVPDDQSVLARPEAALRQLENDRRRREEAERERAGHGADTLDIGRASQGGGQANGGSASHNGGGPAGSRLLRRFHGVVELDTLRISRDAGRLAEEIVQHLSTLPSANVRVRLEIDAEMPEGVPDRVVRTVSENCRTLKFISQGFEEQ